MKKSDQREIIIAAIFFLLGALSSVKIDHDKQLNDYKHKAIQKILLDSYEWKSDRLRVYTDLIYNTKYKP